MSRRFNQFPIESYVEKVMSRHKYLSESFDTFDKEDLNIENLYWIAELSNQTVDSNYNSADSGLFGYIAGHALGTYIDGYDATMIYKWKSCKHVYLFNDVLSKSLSEMPLQDDMPMDALSKIPYPVLYCQTPGITFARGFCVTVDEYLHFDDSMNVVKKEKHLIVKLFPRVAATNISSVNFYLSLERKTLKDAFAEMDDGDAFLNLTTSDTDKDGMKALMASVINHLLYIISENSDQRVVYKSSGKAKRRTTKATVHEAGAIVGRKLFQASIVYRHKEEHEGCGRSPRAHVRRAHFHHYWTGSKKSKEGQQLIVKWLNPILVNTDMGDTSLTTHEAS